MIRIEYWSRWNNEIRRIMHVAPPICDILGVYYNKGRIPPKYTKMQKKGPKMGVCQKLLSLFRNTIERQLLSDFAISRTIVAAKTAPERKHDACLSRISRFLPPKGVQKWGYVKILFVVSDHHRKTGFLRFSAQTGNYKR